MDASLLRHVQHKTAWAISLTNAQIDQKDIAAGNPLLMGLKHHYPSYKISQAHSSVLQPDLPSDLAVVKLEGLINRVNKILENPVFQFIDHQGDVYGNLLSSLLPGSEWGEDNGIRYFSLTGRHWHLLADERGLIGFYLTSRHNLQETHIPLKVQNLIEHNSIEIPDTKVIELSLDVSDQAWSYFPLEDLMTCYHRLLDHTLEICDTGFDDEGREALILGKQKRNEMMFDLLEEAGYTVTY